MKKRMVSAFVAGISAAMFAVMYPEYILLPDTYQYIVGEEMCMQKDLRTMLYADPEQIQISSRLLQFLTDEGIVLWKNNNSGKVGTQ